MKFNKLKMSNFVDNPDATTNRFAALSKVTAELAEQVINAATTVSDTRLREGDPTEAQWKALHSTIDKLLRYTGDR